MCTLSFLPSWLHWELWNEFFACQLVRVVLLEKAPCLSHSSELTRRQTDLCSICDSFVKVESMYHKCKIRCLLPNIISNLGIVLSEVISRISKYSVFPMLRINSFDFAQNGWNFRFFSKSALSDSRFGCVSNGWISFLTAPLRMSSCLWAVDCGTSVAIALATGFPVLFAFIAMMVDGCSRFKIERTLTSMIQIRLEYGSLR